MMNKNQTKWKHGGRIFKIKDESSMRERHGKKKRKKTRRTIKKINRKKTKNKLIKKN